MLRIALVDGMGGGIGSQLVSQIKHTFAERVDIIALGTNSTATTAMIKAGASRGATGENAMRVNLRDVDVILGPLGIIVPNALMGEITPEMAHLIVSMPGRKILLPINQPHVELIGFENRPLNAVIKDTIARLEEILRKKVSSREE